MFPRRAPSDTGGNDADVRGYPTPPIPGKGPKGLTAKAVVSLVHAATMKKIYQKLVRDRIPEIITEAGKDFSVTQMRGGRLKDYAMKKLQEEVQEFIENPCAEEAADIMEIFHFVCNRMGIRDSEIMAQSTSKRILRGGFEMGYILEWVEEG